MIKKTTTVIFKSGKSQKAEEMVGGIPLSKGEVVSVHQGKKTVKYVVVDKIVDCFLSGKDQEVQITYF